MLKNLERLAKDLKLLYVEDNEESRLSTINLLSNFFGSITVAVDGEDGLQKFQEEKFDLIISDISMPKLNGLEMVEKIRNTGSNIPIVMLTAYNDSEYLMQAISLDVDKYILKPIVHDQLIKVLYSVAKKIEMLSLSEGYQEQLEKEVKLRNAELEDKLYNDGLTSLKNRYSFFQDIKKIEIPILLLVDIDEFTIINEVYGNSVGSEVLVKFAQALRSILKDESCQVYRLSADEFAVLDSTREIDPSKYEKLIETLLEELHKLKIEVDGNTILLDVTIGLSTVSKHSYESAKIALEYAKKHRKPYTMYSNAIDHRVASTKTLKCRDNISAAIEDERVVAVYQPIVDPEGKIVKYETLMRLQEKETNKLTTPYYFLDVAIKTRLYANLSERVIFQALELLVEKDITLSMNFTYSDIKNREFINRVKSFFLEHKDIGSRIVFEITENESIENYDDVKFFIKMFRVFGVRIAIDDFGSGFSNFEYILEIEPDYLKIDGTLVKDIDTDEKAHILVQAIVKFSHKLGIKVIAEYVHSKTIYEMLRKLDVDEYQGFYFSEPLERRVIV